MIPIIWSWNGQYTEEEKSSLLEKDRKNLEFYLKTRMVEPGNEPAFPIASIHDKKYRQDFVAAYRHQFNEWEIDKNKLDWLFEYHKDNDKSKYLLKTIGYLKNEIQHLWYDLKYNTDFKAIKYSRISKGKYFICKALTKLKNGKYATTTWELHSENLKVTFVTLLPGKDEYEKD